MKFYNALVRETLHLSREIVPQLFMESAYGGTEAAPLGATTYECTLLRRPEGRPAEAEDVGPPVYVSVARKYVWQWQ